MEIIETTFTTIFTNFTIWIVVVTLVVVMAVADRLCFLYDVYHNRQVHVVLWKGSLACTTGPSTSRASEHPSMFL